MQGAGNDFILFNSIKYPNIEHQIVIEKLCDRKFGIGADGIMLAKASKIADVKMIYFNSDGSRGEMCGNGIRCFSKFVYDEGIVKKNCITIETDDGIKTAFLTTSENEVQNIKIYMGKANLTSKEIPVNIEKSQVINENLTIDMKTFKFSSVLVGVPHTVIICDNLDNIDVNFWGDKIEKHTLFPKKTNVNFIEIIDKKNIKIKTWERGAGRTLACGTGSCSSVFLANLLNLVEKNVSVFTEGGVLNISLTSDGIYMTGSATTVFRGSITCKELLK